MTHAPVTTAALPPLDDVLRSLQQPRLVFFPIRHHSPACAWHVQQWIEANRPATVLIEAPADATELIPLLLHSETQAPVAVYATYVDHDGHLAAAEPEIAPASAYPSPKEKSEPQRFGGYYPFCDYSPELLALRTGAAVGAELRFIDLPYAQKVLATELQANPALEVKLRALQAEQHLQHNTYLSALARKSGCRDFNELWDHLFEAHCQETLTIAFMQQIATYCYLSRQAADPATLAADGTLKREAAMAKAIAAALSETDGQILVVTGGFHTVVLPSLVDAPPVVPPVPKLSPQSAQTVLMRYSFEQLDALNGYGAGMPAPAYYQQLWQHMAQPDALGQTACEILMRLRSLTREQKPLVPLSVADEIAAVEQAQRLAQFRHHPGPTREDLLDAVRSCFVKGAMDGEGAILMAAVARALRGDRVGNLPAHASVPPLVEDFRRQAQTFRLKLTTSAPQSLTLDIYRKEKHRQLSRFLHSLAFADIPFARFTKGPDFVLGKALNQIQEHWNYRWQPQTESTLIEQSLYGDSVAELALYHLRQRVANLTNEGEGRSAIAAVRLLVAACRMGLHTQTERLLALITEQAAADPSVVSLAQALGQLLLLWQSREPLAAQFLETVPQLAIAVYRRLCYLIPQLADCPMEETLPVLRALSGVWEVLQAQADLDAELFIEGLLNLLTVQGNPVVLGGAVGILYSAGRMAMASLVTLAAGYLDHATAEPAQGVGFLRGLLQTCREVTWHGSELVAAINARLENWSDAEFLQVLPELRLAFAELAPRETDRVAKIAAQLHGQTNLGQLVHMSLSEADLHEGLQREAAVRQALAQDNLSHWFTPEVSHGRR
ncbi:hypothetical protein IQ254_24175 [Nodosilinea sp. LEGE 07088]|uniref:DUF5682 family protein n=1 Tax=Nodosilinea sp. LEGE 07088 TaxID=2777968 RepID=UPI001881A7D6|nr:DUF5682 family protein [Nodosilinea sp. LEGE 07088]MBE9140260.1 hypothetical protein [Nodosilinea sp. LEGE 07088]